jgi:hypothetical protein
MATFVPSLDTTNAMVIGNAGLRQGNPGHGSRVSPCLGPLGGPPPLRLAE